jgi:hypothetical protein
VFELKFRLKWVTLAKVGAGLLAIAFVGLVLQEVAQLTGVIKPVVKGRQASVGKAAAINSANFDFLTPGPNKAWTFDPASVVTDDQKGLVKYTVHLTNADVDVIVTQQTLPGELAPRTSDRFQQFIRDQKATISQPVGDGMLYFVPALMNGQPADGTDTVIYANDKILLFGRGAKFVGTGAWVGLMRAMGTGGGK